MLDDLHRADGETLAILADVDRGPDRSRILVLATYRPAEAGEQLSGCLAALAPRQPARVTLRGLDAAAAGELIQATCTRPVDEATARAIAERTGGNPFFIKETARLLDSEGDSQPRSPRSPPGSARCCSAGSPGSRPPPRPCCGRRR